MSQDDGGSASFRVRLDGVDRLASAAAVSASMRDEDFASYTLFPMTGGPLLLLSDAANGLAKLSGLARRLEAAGFDGSIAGHEMDRPNLLLPTVEAPIPPCAAMAFTIDPPYQEGPFYPSGVVAYRWGVPDERTSSLVHQWADWVVPNRGDAVVSSPGADVDRDDAADVMRVNLDRLGHVLSSEMLGQPDGSPTTRLVRARSFGEVFVGETGVTRDRIAQALTLLHEQVLPHAADLDYPTVRVMSPTAEEWTAAGDQGSLWYPWIRHLWSEYVADPNGIQVLTDAHIEKSRDLSTNWTVTSITPGRWLVQARDLAPWFDTIDETAALWQSPYLDPDLLSQARQDFGGMILAPEIAAANRVSQR